MKVRFSILVIATLMVLSSCFNSFESDFEKIVERDDRLVKEHLQRNNIDAEVTPLGFYFLKELEIEDAKNIQNGDTIGVYFEIKTLQGQLIASYLDESLPPKLFAHREGGLIPRAMNFASGLAREGETLQLFVPSYLAYQDYGFQQLIFPNSNLNIRVKYAKIYKRQDIEEIEEALMVNYLEANNLEGFQRTEEGLYLKILSEGDADSPAAGPDDMVFFTFQLFQLGEAESISEITNESNPFQFALGRSDNLDFLDLVITGLKTGAEFEVIAPSHLAFGATTQVFPFQIRKDLFARNFIPRIARPFEPVRMKGKVVQVGD
ncbi:FKBP-type peptidyl-prolyl cis-trans isomerase [Cecembia lonarensis]|uniref:peptidylprolyl isomerase n=1 Tax=Cecembia lonarensis (strain CCUG 58316 / KCTC 22772 / LW9) TaxID=1225176 RepID=K1L2C4_CECL9|nr:FKBP-type peptidyl-prolyl cis-trans isomerase [Cecembia lonarensis]EKB48956.1 peptidyl-prolyl isomerase, gliding motility-associated [Cecembia lonarensis LW9]